MTDKELLELAAKAAGIEGTWFDHGSDDYGLLIQTHEPHRHLSDWNPLEDDGDALRLAVKVGLDYLMYMELNKDLMKLYEKDPYSATRRAIVRAAAEIGKTLK